MIRRALSKVTASDVLCLILWVGVAIYAYHGRELRYVTGYRHALEDVISRLNGEPAMHRPDLWADEDEGDAI